MALSIRYRFPFMTTPQFEARWPYITKPDTQFGEPGEYKIDIPVSDEILDAFEETYAQHFAEFLTKLGDDPKLKAAERKRLESMTLREELVKEYEDKDGNTIQYIRAKTKFPPSVFDSHGKKASGMKVYGGDAVKISLSINPWCSSMGAGISVRLKAVQVIERGEFGGGSNPFADEGSGAVADGGGEEAGGDDQGGSGEAPPFSDEN